jgi:hypothetical protein
VEVVEVPDGTQRVILVTAASLVTLKNGFLALLKITGIYNTYEYGLGILFCLQLLCVARRYSNFLYQLIVPACLIANSFSPFPFGSVYWHLS